MNREVLPARKAKPVPLLCDPRFLVAMVLTGAMNAYGVVATWGTW